MKQDIKIYMSDPRTSLYNPCKNVAGLSPHTTISSSFSMLQSVLFPVLLVFFICLLFPVSCMASAEPVSVDLEDGEYTVDVTLEGGSGRADITSPAVLIVEDGLAYAQIEWSSSHYDYMIIGDTTYYPVNEDGNSIFEIPVTVFDEPINVIGDTTAMSSPHEIEYTLTFSYDSIPADSGLSPSAPVIVIILLLCAAVIFLIVRMAGRRMRKEKA